MGGDPGLGQGRKKGLYSGFTDGLRGKSYNCQLLRLRDLGLGIAHSGPGCSGLSRSLQAKTVLLSPKTERGRGKIRALSWVTFLEKFLTYVKNGENGHKPYLNLWL